MQLRQIFGSSYFVRALVPDSLIHDEHISTEKESPHDWGLKDGFRLDNSLTKVSTGEDVAWQDSSLQIFICFHHFFVPFEKKNEKNLG